MEINYGKTLQTNFNYRQINSFKDTLFLPIDQTIHDEFLTIIRKDLNTKSKTSNFEKNDFINENKFKKWYKMAYPENYKINKSRILSNKMSPSKKNIEAFSPESSIILKDLKLNETVDLLVTKDKLKAADNSSVNKQIMTNNKMLGKSFSNVENYIQELKEDKKLFGKTFKSKFKHDLTKDDTERKSQSEIGLRNYYSKNKKKFLTKVSKGPPFCFRWISWIITLEVPQNRSDKQYHSLLNQKVDSMIENQISKDLHRTLTDDNLFSSESTRKQLFNILKAFAVNDKNLAYCQGMNCIAGFILVVSNYNDVDAFYLMLSLFSYCSGENNNLGIRGFYLPEFPLLQLFLYQFDYIFYKKMPNLKKHFENLGIPNEAWVSKWFQTLYTICLPLNVVTRLWDCIFCFGLEFLFSFTLAILKHFEEDLLKFNDMIDLSEYLKSLNPYLNKKQNKQKLDIEKIIDEGKKIVIPQNVIDNLRTEYEKMHNIDLKHINMKYHIESINDESQIDNKESINVSISSFGDLSHIDLSPTIKGKETTIYDCFANEQPNDYKFIEASVSSEIDYIVKKEVKISDKVNNHVLKLPEINKAPEIVRQHRKSSSKLNNAENFFNTKNTISQNHSKTTNIKSINEGK